MQKFIVKLFLVLAVLIVPVGSFNNYFIPVASANAVQNQQDKSYLPEKPSSNIYLLDSAKMFDVVTSKYIIQEGRKLYKDYNAQLIVVTVDSLEGHDIKQYSNDLFRKWGIGDKRENSGILLLISKKDRKARIEVGYGMEGIIPDGKAGRILNSMFAEFKKENYNKGVKIAHQAIAKEIISAKAKTDRKDTANKKSDQIGKVLIIGISLALALLFIIGIIIDVRRRRKSNYYDNYYEKNASQDSSSSNSTGYPYKKTYKKKRKNDNDDVLNTVGTMMVLDELSKSSHSSTKHTDEPYSSQKSHDDDDDYFGGFGGFGGGGSDFFDSFGGGDSGGGGADGGW